MSNAITVVPGLSALGQPSTGESDPRRILYQSIIRLRDDVFAGKLHSLSGVFIPSPVAPVTNGYEATPQRSSRSQASPTADSALLFQHSQSNVPSAPRKHLLPPHIDPVLLQKSPELIKAEITLQRQRIERDILDDNVPRGPKYNKADIGGDVELDVLEILNQVLLRVPHVSGYKPLENAASESFDENSYYSSKANSWSSPSKGKGDAGDSDAMVMSSDGEISEGEFEPQYEAVPEDLMVVAGDSYQPYLEEEPYQPELMPELMPQVSVNEDENDVYSPPAPISPHRERYENQTSPQQLMQALIGQTLAPHTIAVNQIQTPAAPQPSHISPLATGPLQERFDHSNDPSSRSDPDQHVNNGRPNKRGGKQKDQNGRSRKRRRQQENEPGSGKRKRVEQSPPQSPEPRIKEEPMSPPPFSQLQDTPRRRRTNQGGELAVAKTRQQPFAVPEGYRLVPLDEPNDYPDRAYSVYHPQPQPQPQPQPVFRDAHGNEYYAEPPPVQYQPPPTARIYYEPPAAIYEPIPARTATAYYEPAPITYLDQHSMHPPPRRYGDPHQPYAPAPARPSTAAPEARRYPIDRAYSVHPTATAQHQPQPPQHVSSDIYVPRDPPSQPQSTEYAAPPSSAYAAARLPVGYASASTVPTEYVPVPRGYSLHPAAPPHHHPHPPPLPQQQSAIIDPYRGTTVVPGRGGPQMAPVRAVSVYPTGYAPPPLPLPPQTRQYLEDREDGRSGGQAPMRY
jgi:hypothetical protein